MRTTPASGKSYGAASQDGGMRGAGQYSGAAANGANPAEGIKSRRGLFGSLKAFVGIGASSRKPNCYDSAAHAKKEAAANAAQAEFAEKDARTKLEKQLALDLRPHYGMANADMRKFATAAKTRAQKLYASEANAGRAQMINDPVSGLLLQPRTIQFIKGMQQEVAFISRKVLSDRSISAPMQAKLRAELAALEKILTATTQRLANPDEHGHKILRDCFDETSKRCNKIVAAIGSPTWAAKFSSGTSGQDDPVQKLRTYFRDFGQVALELKRFHFTNWSAFEVDTYARKTVDNIAKYAPGLAKSRTGSESTTSFSFGAGLKTKLFPHAAQCGPSIFGSLTGDKRKVIDEDKEFVVFETFKKLITLGAQFKWGQLFVGGANKGKHIGSVSANVKYSHASGSYHDHKDPLAGTKADIQRSANRWRLLCPSGNPDAFSNKMFLNIGRMRNSVQKVFGALYVPELGAPNVNQKKLNKGAWNTAKLMELTSRFSDNLPLSYRGPASRSIAALVRGAYPLVDSVELDPDLVCSPDGVVAPSVNNAAQKCSPLPSPFNRYPSESGKSISRHAVGAEVSGNCTSLDWTNPQPGQMRAQVSGSCSADYSYNRIHFRRVKPSHEHLDPAYNKDPEVTYRVLREFENAYRGQPKFHTYDAISRTLNNQVWDQRKDPHLQNVLKFENADKALAHLKTTYRRFMHVSSMMRSMQDRRYRASIADKGESADAEFYALAKDLFGIDSNSPPGQRKFLEAMRSKPTLFMQEGFDALSVSLGKVGAHVFDAKRQLHAQRDLNHLEAEKSWKAAQMTDVNYASVKRLMDGVFLPISEEKLLRGASIIADASSINRTRALNTEVTGGFWNSPLQYISGNYGDPTSANSSAPANPVGGVNQVSAANLSISVGTTFRKAIEHPNCVRSGDYRNIRLGASGGGLLGFMVSGGLTAYYKKKQVSSVLGEANTQNGYRKRFIEDTALLAQRMGLVDYAKGIESDQCDRTPHPIGDFTYETSHQYFRLSSKENAAFKASLGVPLQAIGVPITVGISASAAHNVSNVLVETMGDCPAYHMLQYVEMENLLNACKIGALKAKDSDHGLTNKGVDRNNLSKEVDFSKLRNMLAPVMPEDYIGSTAVDAAYTVRKYFGTDDTILGVMEKFLRYDETRREAGGPPVEFVGPRTEFHRFDDNERYFNVVQTMRTGEKFAPASLTNSKSDYAPTREEFLAATSNDARPRIDTVAVAAAMKEMRTQFARKKNMTPEERARCFLGEEGSYGRIVFDAYIQVIGGYCEIHNAVKPTTTYWIGLADQNVI